MEISKEPKFKKPVPSGPEVFDELDGYQDIVGVNIGFS
jgi:hypothetical protein